MKAVFLALLLLFPSIAAAQTPVLKAFLGANAIWFNDEARPTDFEVGATGRASLSKHISGVGAVFYGVDNSYLRGSLGARVTATDVDDPNFSVGLGVQRHFSSEPDIRTEEWAADASIGWRAWPENLPRWILVAQGTYGLSTSEASVLVGVRYDLTYFHRSFP